MANKVNIQYLKLSTFKNNVCEKVKNTTQVTAIWKIRLISYLVIFVLRYDTEMTVTS